MRYLAFVVAIAFYPYFSEASNTPRWIILSVVLPLVFLGTKPNWSECHGFAIAFLVWCGTTILWATAPLDAFHQMWQLVLLAIAFCLGSVLSRNSYRWTLIAFGLGIAVNSVLVAVRLHGFEEIPQWGDAAAGLFVNANFLAEAALMTMAGLLALRLYGVASLSLTAWLFPLSQNVFAASGLLGAIWLWKRSRIAALALIVIGTAGLGAYIYEKPDFWESSIGARASFWLNGLSGLSFTGHGLGSFFSEYPNQQMVHTTSKAFDSFIRPKTAHNDSITIAFETGVIGIALMVAFVASVLKRPTSTREDMAAKAVVAAFLALGLAAFPLYLPTTAFMAALSAGFLTRAGNVVRGQRSHRRKPAFQGNSAAK